MCHNWVNISTWHENTWNEKYYWNVNIQPTAKSCVFLDAWQLLIPVILAMWKAHVEKITELFSRLGANKTGVITYGMFEDAWMISRVCHDLCTSENVHLPMVCSNWNCSLQNIYSSDWSIALVLHSFAIVCWNMFCFIPWCFVSTPLVVSVKNDSHRLKFWMHQISKPEIHWPD